VFPKKVTEFENMVKHKEEMEEFFPVEMNKAAVEVEI
jgi:hypothetical protein